MKAVIPAAGEGSRMDADGSKHLVDVAGRPLLSYVFDTLEQVGTDEFIVVISPENHEIMARFGDRYGETPIRYVHQRPVDGIANAVLAAEPYVDSSFLLIMGDNVFEADVWGAVQQHRPEYALTTLTETVLEDEARRSGVVVEDDGVLIGVVEKPDDPPTRTALAGFHVAWPVLFDACRLARPGETGEVELTTAIDLLIRAGHPINTVPMDGWRVNVNTLEDVEAVERRLG